MLPLESKMKHNILWSKKKLTQPNRKILKHFLGQEICTNHYVLNLNFDRNKPVKSLWRNACG